MRLKLIGLVFILALMVPSVLGAGGVAPSGVGDKIEVGVQRSPMNWLELQFRSFIDLLNPFDPGDRLESKGVTRVG